MPSDAASAPEITRVYLIAEGELPLEATVAKAWPLVLDFAGWQGYSQIERISGTPGEEGEVVLLRKDEEGFEFPPYYSRILKLEPESRVVWKTFPYEIPEGESFFGIVDFRIRPTDDGNSRFIYNVLYEFPVPYESDAQVAEFRQAQYNNFGVLFASVFPKLQRLVRSAAVGGEVR